MLNLALLRVGMNEAFYKAVPILLQLEEKSSNYDFTEAKYIPILKKAVHILTIQHSNN